MTNGRVDWKFRDFMWSQRVRVECRKCGRAGRYRLDQLIAQYGWDCTLTEWGEKLRADCPRRDALLWEHRCFGPSFPDLPDLYDFHGPEKMKRR